MSRTTLKTKEEFIREFEKAHPICRKSSGSGRYIWERCGDSLDMSQQGHRTKKSAKMARASAAKIAYADYCAYLLRLRVPKKHEGEETG